MKNLGKSSRGRSQGVPEIFREPLYGVHCAVIFTIAQLSCLLFRPTVKLEINAEYRTNVVYNKICGF